MIEFCIIILFYKVIMRQSTEQATAYQSTPTRAISGAPSADTRTLHSLPDNARKDDTTKKVIIWTTLVGGFISSLVKWGSEVNTPPRVKGEISPPGAHIDAWLGWTGFNQHSLDYVYQGNTVLGAVSLYHWLFSFAFAFVYVMLATRWNKLTRLWYGAFYGIMISIIFHGFVIPAFGFRNPVYADGKTGWLWNLNFAENFSELLGHIYWAFSIEVCMIAVLAHFGRPIYGKWTR